MKAFWQKHQNE